MKMNAQVLIETLGLQPLPGEGGYYRETYRASETIPHPALPPRYSGARNYSTAIYYLLTPDTFSALHRLTGDEIFHFYLGDPVTMLQLWPDGSAKTLTLGPNILAGQQVQCLAPANVWQGMFLNAGGQFALLGTTVAPGFDFQDFELAKRETLTAQFKPYAEFIRRLTARS